MKTLQFEAVKVEMKQNKNGYILTLCIHPDEVPEDLFRDYVGARYQVVMVRLNGTEQPIDRQNEFESDQAIKTAGMLCRDPKFWDFLHDDTQIIECNEKEAAEWLRDFLNIKSRAELKENVEARIRLDSLHKEFIAWTRK